MRLVGNRTDYEGCVEICRQNVWGSVCDSDWSNVDAAVVCIQLGMPFACKLFFLVELESAIFVIVFSGKGSSWLCDI